MVVLCLWPRAGKQRPYWLGTAPEAGGPSVQEGDAIPATPGRAGGRSAQHWPGCRAASQLAASRTGAPSSGGRPGPSLHPQRRGTCNYDPKPWFWLRGSRLAMTQAVCRQHPSSSAIRVFMQGYFEPQQASCLSVSCKDACADHLMKDTPLLHQVVKAVGWAHRLQPLCQVPILLGIGPLYLPLKCMCISATVVLVSSCFSTACQVDASQKQTCAAKCVSMELV